MNGTVAWVLSAVTSLFVAGLAYVWTTSPGYTFVCAVLYLVAVRGLLFQPELVFGSKTSLKTASLGATTGALLVFTAMGLETGLVPGIDETSHEVIVVVVGMGTATWALGMEYRARLDAE